jgi:hypothetical protein
MAAPESSRPAFISVSMARMHILLDVDAEGTGRVTIN